MREVPVLGGGPAGAAAALGLLRRGVAAAVYERRPRWTGRVCGGFLSPEAVGRLGWLGVLEKIKERGAVPVPRVRVHSAWGFDRTLALPVPGLAFPRKELEDVLLEEVVRRGGKVLLGAAAPDEETPKVLAAGRFGGAAPPKTRRGWYGWNAVFEGTGRPAGEMSLHFGPAVYVGALAFADGRMNVSGLLYKDGTAPWETVFQKTMEDIPSLRSLLGRAHRASDWIGVGPLPHGTDIAPRPGLFPVGDAAAVGDPFLGEGIGRALAAGPMLHAAWATPDPWAAYHADWRRTFHRRMVAGAWIRRLLRRPALLRAALPFLARPAVLPLFPHLRNP
jgi:flavin-dependent dehydrogenase